METVKDFWGNDALDYGPRKEIEEKYGNNLMVTVSNKPFGDPYVLFICEEDEYDKAKDYLDEYRVKMKERGITAYGSGITYGTSLVFKRLDGFMGGVTL